MVEAMWVKTRKGYGRKFALTVAVFYALMLCALMAAESEWAFVAVLAIAAAVVSVWIVCETRVDVAAAPLNLPPISEKRVDKPPEKDAE